MAQICLDQQLIASARRVTTGANIHRIKELIFVYEQAVSLHNCGWPTHRVYQQEHEIALRQFVTKELQLRFFSNDRNSLRPGTDWEQHEQADGIHLARASSRHEASLEARKDRG